MRIITLDQRIRRWVAHAGVLVLASLLVALGSIEAAQAGTRFVTIGTGGVTGVYYPVGGAISKLLNKKKSVYGLKVTAEATAGSVFNINALTSGDMDLGLATAALGAMAFVSATQGWFVTSNRWYEIPLLMAVTMFMLVPGLVSSWSGFPHPYVSFVPGLALYLLVYLLQRRRVRRTAP